METKKSTRVSFEHARPLLEQLATKFDELLFRAVVDVLEQIEPAEVEQAVEWLANRLDDWPPLTRVVSAGAHPAIWRLADVLSIERGPRGLSEKLDRDLSWLQGVSLKAPRRTWVEALLRNSDPSRWRTLTIEKPRADGAALDALGEARLSKLESLILIEASGASLGPLLSWDVPRLETLTLIDGKRPKADVMEKLLDHFSPRELNLVCTRVDELEARAVAAHAEQLESLEIDYAKLPLAGLKALLEVDWPRLRHLDLVGNRLGKAGIRELVAARARLPRVTSLGIGATQPTVAGWEALADSEWMQQLENLSVGGGIDREMPAKVARRFLARSNQQGPVINRGGLRHYVRGVWLAETPEELRELCRSPGLAQVTFLDLGRAASACPEALTACEHLGGVETLWWQECTVGDDDLAAVLARMPRLEQLELRGEWRESGSSRLPARGLARSCVAPKHLELERWSFSADAATRLAKSGILRALRTLYLERCRLRPVDLAALLRAAPELRDFSAHKLELDGDSRTEIVDALCGLDLRDLSVAGLRLGDDGILRLLASGKLDRLDSLSVAANRLTDQSALALAQHLSEKAPISFDASANSFSPKGLEALRALGRLPFWAFHGRVDIERNRWNPRPASGPKPKWVDGEISLDHAEWAFAGTFAMGRHSRLVEAVRQRGGQAQKKLRASAGVVVIGERPGKRKQRAIERGLPLVREERFYELLGTTLEEVLVARIEDTAARLPDEAASHQLRQLLDRWPEDSVDARIGALLEARPAASEAEKAILSGLRERYRKQSRTPSRKSKRFRAEAKTILKGT